jgi:hypothetical protein
MFTAFSGRTADAIFVVLRVSIVNGWLKFESILRGGSRKNPGAHCWRKSNLKALLDAWHQAWFSICLTLRLTLLYAWHLSYLFQMLDIHVPLEFGTLLGKPHKMCFTCLIRESTIHITFEYWHIKLIAIHVTKLHKQWVPCY